MYFLFRFINKKSQHQDIMSVKKIVCVKRHYIYYFFIFILILPGIRFVKVCRKLRTLTSQKQCNAGKHPLE